MLAGVHTPSDEFHAITNGKSLGEEKRLMVFVQGFSLPSTTPARLKALWQNKNTAVKP